MYMQVGVHINRDLVDVFAHLRHCSTLYEHKWVLTPNQYEHVRGIMDGIEKQFQICGPCPSQTAWVDVQVNIKTFPSLLKAIPGWTEQLYTSGKLSPNNRDRINELFKAIDEGWTIAKAFGNIINNA